MRTEFDTMKEDIAQAAQKADDAYNLAQEALDQIVQKDTSQGVYITEY